eukprot:TRINITY_DN9383_c0_g1_i1.p1 TRINITY_DN9383_c0_g1~~TRINITY_DN9383_c0_g1_i1.p1  ORF type:complete len:710 (+),score=155.06 TRINITY_DN9383_c0_g1_i1:76-2130(+)
MAAPPEGSGSDGPRTPPATAGPAAESPLRGAPADSPLRGGPLSASSMAQSPALPHTTATSLLTLSCSEPTRRPFQGPAASGADCSTQDVRSIEEHSLARSPPPHALPEQPGPPAPRVPLLTTPPRSEARRPPRHGAPAHPPAPSSLLGAPPRLRPLRSEVISEWSYLSEPDDAEQGHISWVRAAFVFYAFAMPTGVTSAANMVGAVGWAAAVPLLVGLTGASFAGSWMLAQVAADGQPGSCQTFGDVGYRVFGAIGRMWGNSLQFGNFVLLLPITQVMCAEALRGAAPLLFAPGPSATVKYATAASLACLATTQLRSVASAGSLCGISATAIAAIAALQVYVSAQCPVPRGAAATALALQPLQPFGNPELPAPGGTVALLLGVTSCAWCYIPAFLTAELQSVLRRPGDVSKALALSMALCCATMLAVGYSVTACWGWRVANPVMATPLWAATLSGGAVNRLLCLLLFLANLVAYCVDSVCLSRACARWWLGRSFPIDASGIGPSCRYFVSSLPLWLFAAGVALLLPQLFTVIALATFLTVPTATQLYPAACYAAHFYYGKGAARAAAAGSAPRPGIQVEEATPLLGQGFAAGTPSSLAPQQQQQQQQRGLRSVLSPSAPQLAPPAAPAPPPQPRPWPSWAVALVALAGMAAFCATAAAAFGQLLIPLGGHALVSHGAAHQGAPG